MDKKTFLRNKYNKIKEYIPPETRRQLKKILGKEVYPDVLIRDGEWVSMHIEKCKNVVIRKKDKRYSANIRKEDLLPMESRAKDLFIERQLHKEVYTWDNMLVIQNPYGMAPLTALALFTTGKKCAARFTVKGKKEKDDVTGLVREFTNYHRLPIIGLYPDQENEVIIELIAMTGSVVKTKKFKLLTQPLHDKMKDMVRVEKFCGESAYNLTFVYGGDTKYPYAYDSAGDIRYFIERTPKPYGLHPLSGGRFLFSEKDVLMPSFSNPHATQALDMDLLGRVHNIFNVERGLHHDVNEMVPGGNLIVAASSLEGYTEDAILELDRKTGIVVKELHMDDLFDDTYKTSVDWAHINTVSYNREDHTVVACLRNLHSVIKVDWNTGGIIWILGNPEFWKETAQKDKVLTPVEGFDAWSYQPHAAYLLKENLDGNPETKHLIIYDNHWHKRRPVPFFDKDKASYVRIYTINEKERTLAHLKNFASAKSKIRSNGILNFDRNCLFVMSGYLEPPIDGCDGMIYEYEYTTGRLKNQYSTVNSFYRAYEFWADYDEMAKPMDLESNYMRGSLLEPVLLEEKPDFAKALAMPAHRVRWMDKEDEEGNAAVRRKKLRKEVRKSIWEQEAVLNDGNVIDYDLELSYLFMRRREDFLYINTIDHFVAKVYFVGRKKTYVQDYTKTWQTVPSLFAKLVYYVAVPLAVLPMDHYEIYLECKGKIYDTDRYIQVMPKQSG